MKILPITYNNQNPVSFAHHPDFEKMIKAKEPIIASSYFRRSPIALYTVDSFTDIINTFKEVFQGEFKTPKKMLIVGVADSQEPFSYLASIRQIVKDKPIQEILDLYIVDLQSAPEHKKLYNNSHTLGHLMPEYAKEGFVRSEDLGKNFYNYRIKNDLFNFLEQTYMDPKKSKWESRIQEVIKDYPDNYFDIVSMNNVLFYLPESKKYPTLENVYRTIKNDGYFITEGNFYVDSSSFRENMEKTNYGIYRKIL